MARERKFDPPATADAPVVPTGNSITPSEWPLGKAVVPPPKAPPAAVVVEAEAVVEAPAEVPQRKQEVAKSPRAPRVDVGVARVPRVTIPLGVEELVIADMVEAVQVFKDAEKRHRASALEEVEQRIRVVKVVCGLI